MFCYSFLFFVNLANIPLDCVTFCKLAELDHRAKSKLTFRFIFLLRWICKRMKREFLLLDFL